MAANWPERVIQEDKATGTVTFTAYSWNLHILIFIRWPHSPALIQYGGRLHRVWVERSKNLWGSFWRLAPQSSIFLCSLSIFTCLPTLPIGKNMVMPHFSTHNFFFLYPWYCSRLSLELRHIGCETSRQLDRHEQNRDGGPGAEGHQEKEPWVPGNGQSCQPLHDHSL